ncbi:hypothetical protein ABPG74_017257 [Tetrahymena malaccensis]
MSDNQQQKEDKTTFLHAFKQQIMKAWQPVPTLNSTIIVFAILSTIFLVFGIVLVVFTNKILDSKVRYDTKCSTINYPNSDAGVAPAICTIQFTVTEDMESPVFVYYELTNFYQNHRRYVKSKSVVQLQGDSVSYSDVSNCEPIIYYSDLRKYRYVPSNLKDGDYAWPCGLIAASLFNDTYTLLDPSNNHVPISSTNIAWPSDKSTKYKNKDMTIQWTNVEDERFMVWMRTAALPDFRKLWGRIDQKVPAGTYTVQIANNYPVDSFDGTKSFVLSTANAFGGRNSFLGISYLVMGIICFIILLVFIFKKIRQNKPKQQKEN